MTKEQYENLMYALSTIIALSNIRTPVPCVPGIPYQEVEKSAKERLEKEVKEVYRNLTGSPSNRGK